MGRSCQFVATLVWGRQLPCVVIRSELAQSCDQRVYCARGRRHPSHQQRHQAALQQQQNKPHLGRPPHCRCWTRMASSQPHETRANTMIIVPMPRHARPAIW
mmetsp:Transcript_47954/g.108058  ORF Transcript_47954/g.108058 Transcript_47954/m.108058 type:complete len:102 (+) Transcript_47954:649-954(+)